MSRRKMGWVLGLLACSGGQVAVDAGPDLPEDASWDAAVDVANQDRSDAALPTFRLGATLRGGGPAGHVDRYIAELPAGLMEMTFRAVEGRPSVTVQGRVRRYRRSVDCNDCSRPMQFFIPTAGAYDVSVADARAYELATAALPTVATGPLPVTSCEVVLPDMGGPGQDQRVDLDACPAAPTAAQVQDGEVFLYAWRADTDRALIWGAPEATSVTLFDVTAGRPVPWANVGNWGRPDRRGVTGGHDYLLVVEPFAVATRPRPLTFELRAWSSHCDAGAARPIAPDTEVAGTIGLPPGGGVDTDRFYFEGDDWGGDIRVEVRATGAQLQPAALLATAREMFRARPDGDRAVLEALGGVGTGGLVVSDDRNDRGGRVGGVDADYVITTRRTTRTVTDVTLPLRQSLDVPQGAHLWRRFTLPARTLLSVRAMASGDRTPCIRQESAQITGLSCAQDLLLMPVEEARSITLGFREEAFRSGALDVQAIDFPLVDPERPRVEESEPNDSRLAAHVLSPSVTLRGHSDAEAADWFGVDLRRGQHLAVYVEVEPVDPDPLTMGIRVVDGAETVLAEGHGVVVYAATRDARVFVALRLSHDTPRAYTAQVMVR